MKAYDRLNDLYILLEKKFFFFWVPTGEMGKKKEVEDLAKKLNEETNNV